MKYFFLFLSAVVVLAACTQEAPEVTPSTENLMRSKQWKLTGGTMTVKNPNGKDTSLPYTDYIEDCYKDDYLKFDSAHFGLMYSGGEKCDASDPEARNFTWRLYNNDKYIDLLDGFNRIFAVTQTIEPYRFETLSEAPLVLDTIIGRLDTIPGFLKEFIVLDTVREVRFTPYKIEKYDLYGAELVDFTESSFKLKFSFKTRRLDSTNFHGGAPNNEAPIDVPDTTDYLLTYSAF